MKITYLSLLLLLGIFQSLRAQEKDLLLEIAEPWRSERLSFPIPFAPSIDYKGIEEVRFAKGWGDKNSEAFWAYAFLWYLDENPELTENQLERDIQAYFDGIMSLVGKGNGLETIPKSKVVFTRDITATELVKGNNFKVNYKGEAAIFDAFFTKSAQTLNITAVSDYCPVLKKYTVLFTFSPQDRDHTIWETLNSITLTQACN
jgi:hypothetical protein